MKKKKKTKIPDEQTKHLLQSKAKVFIYGKLCVRNKMRICSEFLSQFAQLFQCTKSRSDKRLNQFGLLSVPKKTLKADNNGFDEQTSILHQKLNSKYYLLLRIP